MTGYRQQLTTGSPPLTRGILCRQAVCPFHPGFTPAHAGNTRLKLSVAFKCQVHPRSRGEYCVFVVGKCIPTGFTPAHAGNTTMYTLSPPSYKGSPPLTRGIQAFTLCLQPLFGFTPAHAGNTLKKALFYLTFSNTHFHISFNF